jgi:hypothetical protein
MNQAEGLLSVQRTRVLLAMACRRTSFASDYLRHIGIMHATMCCSVADVDNNVFAQLLCTKNEFYVLQPRPQALECSVRRLS